MGTVSRILDGVGWLALVLGMLLIAAMAVLMNVEIVSRYVFGVSTQISDEYAGYLFTAATMLGFLPALRDGRFLQLEAVTSRMPDRVRAVMEAVASLAGAFVAAVLCHQTALLVQLSHELETVSLQASQTPLVLPQLMMPIGFALLVIGFIEQGCCRAWRLWTGRGLPNDAGELSRVLD